VRLAFAYVLESYGFKVGAAADGAEALAYLATHQVDVILTDLLMPGVDGLALLRTVLAGSPPQPRVIAMSGAVIGAGAALDAARGLQVDAVLSKPVLPEQLVATIQRVMSGRRP
jgi:CheY-like chemotaxis protein